MKTLNLGLAIVLAAVCAGAQDATPKFEVASVKLNSNRSGSSIGGMTRGDRFIATEVTLVQLLRTAYGVQEFQIVGQPAWANSDRYDVEGKMGRQATYEESLPMLQALLAERFKLALRREQRQMTMYTLVVARNGPKLKATDQSKCANPEQGCVNMAGSPTSISATNVTMAQLATRLARSTGVIVTDKTGLTGRYDFKLEWPADEPFTSPGASANASIYAALQDQLGLRLESTRGPVETLVIDRAEKPTDN